MPEPLRPHPVNRAHLIPGENDVGVRVADPDRGPSDDGLMADDVNQTGIRLAAVLA